MTTTGSGVIPCFERFEGTTPTNCDFFASQRTFHAEDSKKTIVDKINAIALTIRVCSNDNVVILMGDRFVFFEGPCFHPSVGDRCGSRGAPGARAPLDPRF